MTMPEFEKPNWQPLKLHLGVTCDQANCTDENCPITGWMWMYRQDGFEYYKNHSMSPKYLRLPTLDLPY